MPDVYLFWDNSNIFHSAQRYCERTPESANRSSIRISFEQLYRLAIAGRNLKKGIAVGSLPPEQKDLWDRFAKDTGIDIELYERGAISKKEQGVDQCLQTHMLRALADENDPQIAVLLTGDGSGFADGIGFHADLARMYERGWGIEVISWDLACKKELREWSTSSGVYIKLEDYYNEVTFISGGRTTTPLSLTRRQKSDIGKSDAYVKKLKESEEKKKLESANKLLLQKQAELQKTIEELEKREEKSKKRERYYKKYASREIKK